MNELAISEPLEKLVSDFERLRVSPRDDATPEGPGIFATSAIDKRCNRLRARILALQAVRELCEHHHEDTGYWKECFQHFPDFHFSPDPLSFHPLDDQRAPDPLRSTPLFMNAEDRESILIYCETGFGSETLPLRLSNPTSAGVEAWVGQRWAPFKKWLRDNHMTRSKVYTRQRRILHENLVESWRRNGKVFRLLDLPLELRELIYKHAIGAVVETQIDVHGLSDFDFTEKTTPKLSDDGDDSARRGCTATRSVTFSQECLHADQHSDYTVACEGWWLHKPAYQLFQTSKQIHREAGKVFSELSICRFRGDTKYGRIERQPMRWLSGMHKNPWYCNTWPPWSDRGIVAVEENMHVFNASLPDHKKAVDIALAVSTFGPPRTLHVGFAYESLRRIQLCYDNWQYCRSLGFLFYEGTTRRRKTTISIRELCHLPLLRYVDFCFVHPSRRESSTKEPPQLAVHCQKAFVDWFLTVALDELSPCCNVKFSISGCVKHGTRRKWEEIFEDRRLGRVPSIEKFKDDQRSRFLVESKWDKERLTAPCRCSRPFRLEWLESWLETNFSDHNVNLDQLYQRWTDDLWYTHFDCED